MTSDRPPETVRAYLDQLRRALKGAPAGLIADALADTEDHLNNEIANNPDLKESEILASVIETYGTPQEIAEEYRDMETTIAGPFPKNEPTPQNRKFGFFNVISDSRTYGALLYMLLSLATGIFYFVWTLAFGLISTIFMIFIIGLPLMLFFLTSVRVLAHVEGRVVEALLGVRMPRRPPTPAPAERGFIIGRLKAAASDITTWSSMFYLLLMLPLGILYFVFAVLTMVVPLAISVASMWGLITNEPITDGPIIHMQGVHMDPWFHQLTHTAPGLAILAVGGLLTFFIMLHAARGIGWLHAKLAEVLLVRL